MSHIDQGPLSQYNSLVDSNLAGYFSNTRMRRHLKKAGLITKNGHIVSENTYRLNTCRREHKQHVKEMLAQAIVHKTLDLERMRQAEIRKKLEEIAKIELVRSVRMSRHRKRDADILPYISPRSESMKRAQSNHIRDRHKNRSTSAPSKKGTRPISSLSSNYDEDDEDEVVYLDDDGRPLAKDSKRSKGSIDMHQLYALDTAALRKYAMEVAKLSQRKYCESPYLVPQIPIPPKSPRSERLPRSGRRYKTSSSLGSYRTVEDQTYLHPRSPPRAVPSQRQSKGTIEMKYLGSNLHLAREQFDKRQDILVEQQHCGGNTLIAFRGKLEAGETFSFNSKRHTGYPFALTIYIDGKVDCRVSTCCEYHHRGIKLFGKNGHFRFEKVSDADPCYKCQVENSLKRKHNKRNKTTKKQKAKPEAQNEDVDEVDQGNKENAVSPKVEKEEEKTGHLYVPVEDDTKEGNKYDEDFESSSSSSRSSSRSRSRSSSSNSNSDSSDQEDKSTTKKYDNDLQKKKHKRMGVDKVHQVKTNKGDKNENVHDVQNNNEMKNSEKSGPSVILTSDNVDSLSDESDFELKSKPVEKSSPVAHVPNIEVKHFDSDTDSSDKESSTGQKKKKSSSSSSSSISSDDSDSHSSDDSDSHSSDTPTKIHVQTTEVKEKKQESETDKEKLQYNDKIIPFSQKEKKEEIHSVKKPHPPATKKLEKEEKLIWPSTSENKTSESQNSETNTQVKVDDDGINQERRDSVSSTSSSSSSTASSKSTISAISSISSTSSDSEESENEKEKNGLQSEMTIDYQEKGKTTPESLQGGFSVVESEKEQETREKEEKMNLSIPAQTETMKIEDSEFQVPEQRRDSDASSSSVSSSSSSSSLSTTSSSSQGSFLVKDNADVMPPVKEINSENDINKAKAESTKQPSETHQGQEQHHGSLPSQKQTDGNEPSAASSVPLVEAKTTKFEHLNPDIPAPPPVIAPISMPKPIVMDELKEIQEKNESENSSSSDSESDSSSSSSDSSSNGSDKLSHRNGSIGSKKSDDDNSKQVLLSPIVNIQNVDKNSNGEQDVHTDKVLSQNVGLVLPTIQTSDNMDEDGQVGDSLNKVRSHPPEPRDGSILNELEKGHHIVDIKNVKLTKSQIHEAAEFLEKKKDMSQLSIVNCHLCDEDIRVIKDALIASPSKPVVLNLNDNLLTSGCIDHLLQLFKNKPSIEAILLTGCNLGDDGVKKLVDGLLEQHKDLLSGDIIEKDVQTDEETNRELRELDLSNCNFGDEGIEALCSLIRSGMAIDTLNLSMNRAVTQKGWTSFAHALTRARVLETLTLDNNCIGNEGLEELARSLYDNTSLAALDLNNIQVTDKGGKCLVELLKRNICLLEINLQENSLSEQLIVDINKYISLNKSIAQ